MFITGFLSVGSCGTGPGAGGSNGFFGFSNCANSANGSNEVMLLNGLILVLSLGYCKLLS